MKKLLNNTKNNQSTPESSSTLLSIFPRNGFIGLSADSDFSGFD